MPPTIQSDRWADAAVWTGDGLRREVFLFPSGGERLYGSLYAADPPVGALGLVVCPSWGWEGARLQDASHALARAVAGLGGSALVLHWPGHGDSTGDLRQATVDRLVAAAADGLAEAGRRAPARTWALAGVRLGASVAALAAPATGAQYLVLLQPALDPGAYFDRLERAARRAALGRTRPGWAFGHPLPEAVRWSATGEHVVRALQEYPGRGAAVQYATPPPAPVPGGLDRVTVRGDWDREARRMLRGPGDLRPLVRAAVGWLRSAAGGRR